MYQIDSSKRYNVTASTNNYGKDVYKNVHLLDVAPNLVIFRDEGKDVIITGGMEITIKEV